jgi:hypothetical protein
MITEVLPVTGNKGVQKATDAGNGMKHDWNGGGKEEGRKYKKN